MRGYYFPVATDLTEPRSAEYLVPSTCDAARWLQVWGYAPDEDLSVEDMLKVKYQVQALTCCVMTLSPSFPLLLRIHLLTVLDLMVSKLILVL